MRIYIIGNAGITLSRELPAAVSEDEIVVASNEELHAARLRRQAAAGAVERAARCRKASESRRTRGADRSAVVGDRSIAGPQSDAKRASKQDAVIAMLRRPEGTTVDEVASATGWQRHTVRGLFSGTLKKKLGLTLASVQEERGRVYRIGAPANF